MKCKFCGAEIDKNLGICPECGLEVPPEEMKKKRTGLKIALAVTAVVLVLAVLAGIAVVALGALGIWTYKDYFNFEEKENNAFYKDSYTVDEKTADKKSNVVIATAADNKLDNGTFQFYYAMNVMNFLNNNSYYLSYMGLDYTLPLDEQYANEEEGITWQQMFIDSALGDWYSYTIMNKMAAEEGYTISAGMQSSIDTLAEELQNIAVSNGFMDAQSMIDADFGPGYDVEDYITYQKDRFAAVDYVSHLYQVLKPTAEEVEVYFAENEETFAEEGITKDSGVYGTVRHILLQPEGGEENEEGEVVYSDEAWAACEAEAQALLKQWLEGEANEDTFAQLANQFSTDPGSNTNGGLYAKVMEGQMVEEFDYWLFFEEHAYGDYGLVKTTYGYHLMYFVSVDDIWTVEAEEQMIDERIEEKVKAAEEKWPIEKSYKKIVLNDLKLS